MNIDANATYTPACNRFKYMRISGVIVSSCMKESSELLLAAAFTCKHE